MRPSERTLKAEQERIDGWLSKNEGVRAPQLRAQMNKTMSDNVFIFRNEKELKKAVDDLLEIRKAFDRDVYVMDKSKTFNTDLVHAMEGDFLIDAAMCVANGALARKESRGAQARTDYPERDDENWMVHTLAWRQEG